MASRVGTYLSDDNIRNVICPSKFAPPASKTYDLFQTPTAGNQYRTQRPQNPLRMMQSLSALNGVPISALREKYVDSLRQIDNQRIGVIDAPRIRHSAVASVVPVASRGGIVPLIPLSIAPPLSGSPSSRRSRSLSPGSRSSNWSAAVGRNIGRIKTPTIFTQAYASGKRALSPGGTSAGSSSASSSATYTSTTSRFFGQQINRRKNNPIVGGGNLGTYSVQQFQTMAKTEQIESYKMLYQMGKADGVDFSRVVGLTESGISNIPGGELARASLFQTLETALYQSLGQTDAQILIDTTMGAFSGHDPPATAPIQGGQSSLSVPRLSPRAQGKSTSIPEGNE